jgi:hypothetical protein
MDEKAVQILIATEGDNIQMQVLDENGERISLEVYSHFGDVLEYEERS